METAAALCLRGLLQEPLTSLKGEWTKRDSCFWEK